MELTLFDLDNTLLNGDSDYAWAQFLIDQGVLDRAAYEVRNLEFYGQYKAGTLDIHAFLDFQLAPLAKHSRTQLDAWHRQFMQETIEPMVAKHARALIESHRVRERTLAIVTATNTFITGPIAAHLNIPHLIGTEIEEIGGRFTGRSKGTPSFREGKIARVEEWLAGAGRTLAAHHAVWFYSDSANDLSLLEIVSHPVAVDPDDRLRAIAQERGWPIISLH
ncbi:MAG: HAD family hydrolase [Betaproteobacteria bacterium]|nr:HAD family hydrolase [Betaproteobacteria bacterium]